MIENEKFSDEWKLACLKFLREMRKQLKISTGYKRVGWGPIRDAIMTQYDKIVDGEIVVYSDCLQTSTLEAWDRRADASITDKKFRYIDEYMRRLAVSGDGSPIVEMFRTERFREISKSLLKVYNPRLSNKALEDIKDIIPEWAMSTRMWESPYRNRMMAIKTLNVYNEALHILCALLPFSEFEEETIRRETIFYEGVAVPLDAKSLIRFRSSGDVDYYSVKLFREEFNGIASIGYADGQIVAISSTNYNPSTSVTLHRPSSWFSLKIAPQDEQIDLDGLQSGSSMAVDLRQLMNSKDSGEFEGFKEAYTDKDSDFLDKFFGKYYLGYL